MPNIWDDPPDIEDDQGEYPDDHCQDCPHRNECNGTEDPEDPPDPSTLS